ncbi:hypothetical protein [Treponema zioleckii]|uniref:hypothetical protein n=1 Tax=Treponema zioleckii TaxID=331680 RepID=UPI00168B25CD|nr:hypothetical protein [Treponema zioleckii]
METSKIILATVLTLLFASCATTKSADTAQKSVTEKIDFLLQDKVLELNSEELKPFKSESFLKTLISRFAPEAEMTSAVRDYLEVGNYEILNAIKFDGKIFLNYLLRSHWSIAPKNKKSTEVLGRDLLQHHIFFLCDEKSNEILAINYICTNYTPILFHRYEYGGKSILYGIGNNSSSGMATTDLYFVAVSAENLELLFSERVKFSQAFFSNEVDDIAFERDFSFSKNSVVIKGKDFDFNNRKLVDYEKTYSF